MFCYLYLSILIFPLHAAHHPTVETPFGKIRGSLYESYNERSYSQFLGIPYAKPPVGNLRFEEPQKLEPWSGTWQANISTECIQINHYYEPEGGNLIGQEDCLYLNIFVPRKNPKEGGKLDVIVHIHGGAFNFGYGNNYAGPKYLMDHDIILISFNYRLGPFGFLSTGDEVVPGNNGMKDQTMALKWIKENVQYFGGNPDSITITGLSAGGASVHYHYLSPLSKGLFNRGISVSGSALCPWTLQEEPLAKTRILASAVGCPEEDVGKLIACLKERPARHIVENVRIFRPWLYNPFSPFALVVEKNNEKAFLPEHPYELLSKGKVQDLPWISSVTSDEGLYPAADYILKDSYLPELERRWKELAPHVLDYDYTIPADEKDSVSEKIKKYYLQDEPISKDSYKELIQMVGDRHFVVPVEKATRLQANANKSPVYFYYFSYFSKEYMTFAQYYAPYDEKFGVCHGDDVVFVLSVPERPARKLNKNDETMKDLLLNVWITFAKTGKPSIQGLEWKAVRPQSEQLDFLHIQSPEKLSMNQTKQMGHGEFWKSLPFAENENLFTKSKDEL